MRTFINGLGEVEVNKLYGRRNCYGVYDPKGVRTWINPHYGGVQDCLVRMSYEKGKWNFWSQAAGITMTPALEQEIIGVVMRLPEVKRNLEEWRKGRIRTLNKSIHRQQERLKVSMIDLDHMTKVSFK
jgi:hypothetical protein